MNAPPNYPPIFNDVIWWVGSGNFSRLVSETSVKLALKMALYRYFTRERLTYPTKVPSLSDKQVVKTNAEVKRVQQKDTSGHGKHNEYTPEERVQIGKNMDPQRRSDNSQSFCPGKFSFLYTAQPPYFHFDTSIKCSNWAEHLGYVYVA